MLEMLHGNFVRMVGRVEIPVTMATRVSANLHVDAVVRSKSGRLERRRCTAPSRGSAGEVATRMSAGKELVTVFRRAGPCIKTVRYFDTLNVQAGMRS